MTVTGPIFENTFFMSASKGDADSRNLCYPKQNKKLYLNMHKTCS